MPVGVVGVVGVVVSGVVGDVVVGDEVLPVDGPAGAPSFGWPLRWDAVRSFDSGESPGAKTDQAAAPIPTTISATAATTHQAMRRRGRSPDRHHAGSSDAT